jgi:hypothetical protein
MVALVYYSFLIGYLAIGVVGQGIKTMRQHRAAESDVVYSHPAIFDVNKDCKVVYIRSPIDYQEDTVNSVKAKSGKDCVIRIFTYSVRNETEVWQPHPSTLDTSRSVPSVLELPRNGTD